MCDVAYRQRTKQQNMDTSEEISHNDMLDYTTRDKLLGAIWYGVLLDVDTYAFLAVSWTMEDDRGRIYSMTPSRTCYCKVLHISNIFRNVYRKVPTQQSKH